MKFSLINPNWSFDGGIYFGCREPHLPLEFGYSKALLEQQGHEVNLINAHAESLTLQEITNRVDAFAPHVVVIATANSYLFWRCAQPELRVPMEVSDAVRGSNRKIVVVGPHGSTTPSTALQKLRADIVVMGECEEILPLIALHSENLQNVPSICYRHHEDIHVQGSPHACEMNTLPALKWQFDDIAIHQHHHHRFDAAPTGPGAEMEVSRGCPYHCTFCAKENFRNLYRKRPVQTILEELDALLENGVEYVYFIDEIFLPDKKVLEGFSQRSFNWGMQTRIDLWPFDLLELAGQSGCVSIEAGVESITEEGRELLDKKCRMTTQQLSDRLIFAKQQVPFVQANLLESEFDDMQTIEEWRDHLQKHGVWANKPVPLFPYPGSPEYTRRWGLPDDNAWERAQDYYLSIFDDFSDIQDQQPLRLQELEARR